MGAPSSAAAFGAFCFALAIQCSVGVHLDSTCEAPKHGDPIFFAQKEGETDGGDEPISLAQKEGEMDGGGEPDRRMDHQIFGMRSSGTSSFAASPRFRVDGASLTSLEEAGVSPYHDDRAEPRLFNWCLVNALLIQVFSYTVAKRNRFAYLDVAIFAGAFIVWVPMMVLKLYYTSHGVHVGESSKNTAAGTPFTFREYTLGSVMKSYQQDNLMAAMLLLTVAILTPIANLVMICLSAHLRSMFPEDEAKQVVARRLIFALQWTCRLPVALVFFLFALKALVAKVDYDGHVQGSLMLGSAFFLAHAVGSVVAGIMAERELPLNDHLDLRLDRVQAMPKQRLLVLVIIFCLLSFSSMELSSLSVVIRSTVGGESFNPYDLLTAFWGPAWTEASLCFVVIFFLRLCVVTNLCAISYTAFRLTSARPGDGAQSYKVLRMTNALSLVDMFILGILMLRVASRSKEAGFFWESMDIEIGSGLGFLIVGEGARLLAYFLVLAAEPPK